MKKRTKIVIGIVMVACVAAGVVGCLFFQPPTRFDFMRGAQYRGITIAPVPFDVFSIRGEESAYDEYQLAMPFAEACSRADEELAATQGWASSPFLVTRSDEDRYYKVFSKDNVVTVAIGGDDNRGTVTIVTPVSGSARFRAWLWKLTKH
ncbi:MAG: hypothetical protein WD716_01200 [Fimbriimonadaceae bacterium]